MPRNSKNFMSCIRAADTAEYNHLGRSDDLRRFLINTNVLIEDRQRKVDYFDDERARHVEVCCEKHTNPDPPIEPLARLDQLKKIVADRKAAEAARKVEVALQMESPRVEADPETVQTVSDQESQQDVDAGMLPQDNWSPHDIVPSITHVLFFTATEDDVWTTFCVLAKDTCLDQTRVATGDELDEFAQRYASSNLQDVVAAQAWKDAVARFETCGLVAKIKGVFKKGGTAYRLCEDYRRFRVVRIVERDVVCESSKEERATMRVMSVPHDHVDYFKYLENGFLWGLRYESEDGQTLPSWPGFERVDFCDHGVPAPEMPHEPEPELEPVTGADEPQSEMQEKYWHVRLNREQATFLLEIARNGEMQNIKDAFDYKNRTELVRIGLLVRRGERRWSTWVVDGEVAKRCLFRVSFMRTVSCWKETRSNIPDPNDWVLQLSKQIETPKEISAPVDMVVPEGFDDPPPNVENVEVIKLEKSDVSKGGVTSDTVDPETLSDEEIESRMIDVQTKIDSLRAHLDQFVAIKKARTEEKLRAFEERRRKLDEQEQELEARKRALKEERQAIELEMQAFQQGK